MAPLVNRILESYPLDPLGVHGVIHWARVYENGMRMIAESGADEAVVALFAVFHDSQRLSNGADPDHGRRGAELAAVLRGEFYTLTDERFELLQFACRHHTHLLTHSDVTIQTCFDADRLDLGRVGITPDPARLCTAAAKADAMRSWATRRGDEQHIPLETLAAWGVTHLLNQELVEQKPNPYARLG